MALIFESVGEVGIENAEDNKGHKINPDGNGIKH